MEDEIPEVSLLSAATILEDSDSKNAFFHLISWAFLFSTLLVVFIVMIRVGKCIRGYCRDFEPLNDIEEIRKRYERHWQEFQLLENSLTPRSYASTTEMQPITSYI
ncbi:unnamed protein product, partial [Mesorhabditis belari]|uniref:Uncharacterized protein n=1 Tax=Mesorhabditis belari TaxID=2138241 RepID=A0AAF3E879_9BILA